MSWSWLVLIGAASTTTLNSFGLIYRQSERFAMHDLLLATMCRIFIEHLEKQVIPLALKKYRPILRYMDDILERVNAGHTHKVTDYSNSTDHIGKMKFTHKEENRQIHFQPFWKLKSTTPPTEIFKSK